MSSQQQFKGTFTPAGRAVSDREAQVSMEGECKLSSWLCGKQDRNGLGGWIGTFNSYQ